MAEANGSTVPNLAMIIEGSLLTTILSGRRESTKNEYFILRLFPKTAPRARLLDIKGSS
jgi:hypothetical protein